MKAEENFHGFLEYAPDAVVIAGADGRIRFVNVRTEEMFGYARDELIDQPVEMLMPERFRVRHVGHREDYTHEPRTRFMGQGFDLYGRRRDGSEFPVEISLSPVGGGKDLLVYAAVRDVSAQRKTEQALRESEQRFRQMAETVGEVFWMTSPDSRTVLYVSPAFERVWGRSCAQLYKNPMLWLEAIHPDDLPGVQRAIEALCQGAPYDIEYRIARPDGTRRWISDHGYPRRDSATGQVTLITGVASDITERKHAERRFRAVTETANDAVVSADSHGNIVYFNPAAERIFGYAAAEALGRPLTLLMPERFRDPHREGLRRFLAGGGPRVIGKTVQLAGRRKDGSEFPLELSLASWQMGPEVYFTGIMRDVSERKQAQEALRRMNEELERKVEERTRQLQEREARIRRLVDSNIIGIVFWQLDGAITDANDAFLTMVGHTRQDLLSGKIHWWDMTPPEYRAVDLRAVEELRSTGSTTPFEKEYVRKDGSRVPVLLGGALFEKSADSGVAFAIDLTERKQLEQQLSRRIYHLDVMERISRISLTSQSVEELLERVLDEVLFIFNADRAWFLCPCDPDAPSWSVPMEHTRPEWPGAFARGAVIPMTPGVAEVFRELLASAEPLPYGPATSHNIPAAVAEEYSIRSQIQMALRPRAGSPWVMGLHHCAQAHAYSEDDLLLFKDIGQRVADALSSMIILKDLRESNRQLVAAQEDMTRIMTSISDYLWSAEIDAEGNMTYQFYSPVVKDITGRPPEFYMQSPDRWLSTVYEEDRPRMFQAFKRIVTGKSDRETEEYRVVLPDGSLRWLHDSVKVTRLAGGRARVDGVVSDISARKQAATDSLTGIANRRAFSELLESEIVRARRYGAPLALIMYDIDNFKEVNDTHGHDTGDEILKGVTDLVRTNIRAADATARWGGEEFVILAPQCDFKGAAAMAEKLRATIAGATFDKAGTVTASFGVAVLDARDNQASLLKKADAALYKAKANGRNRVEAIIERT